LTSSWVGASKDKVFYASGENEEGDISIGTLLGFERINGKWYLTFILQVG
jgi:hypothetical protein